ncbi:hypothetical protein BBBGCB_BBBGCB_09710, partial [Dysosmobacter welbionis]
MSVPLRIQNGSTVHPMAGGVSWLLADFQHGLINSLCGVPDSQGGHGPLHGGPARSVMKDAAGRLEQRLTGAVLLQQHHGTAGVFQDPRVFFLVVVGDIGGRHDQRRDPQCRQLADGGGPRPAEHQIRRPHDGGHIIDVLPHLQRR